MYFIKNYLGDLYHHPNTYDNFSFNTLGYKVKLNLAVFQLSK